MGYEDPLPGGTVQQVRFPMIGHANNWFPARISLEHT